MLNIIVRVELHHAHSSDYSVLHSEMHARGFSQTAETTDGKIYHLPTAQYLIKHSLLEATPERTAEFTTAHFVQNLVKEAISATITESKKQRTTSYLKGSCITCLASAITVFQLDEVE